MNISEVMHKDIKCVSINDSVKKVAELMKREDIGSVPVMDGNKPVGIVTDRDIVINCLADGADLNAPIKRTMSEDLVCVRENQTVEEASRMMAERQISRILVVDESEMPVGMVSLKDLTRENEDLAEETLSRIKQ
jgi:CBS domain-containing protein